MLALLNMYREQHLTADIYAELMEKLPPFDEIENDWKEIVSEHEVRGLLQINDKYKHCSRCHARSKNSKRPSGRL